MSTKPQDTQAFNDRASQVREGEELPIEKVDAFVKQHIPGLQGTPIIEQFAGGASNLTYLLRYTDRDLILRRPPFGHRAKSAHDMLREAKIMQALKPVYPYVPAVIASCDDASIMDCDFYVMERIHGIIPRHNLPKGMVLSEEETRRLCLNVIDKMIELHQIDVQAAGLAGIAKGEGYVQRQMDGWSERYRKAKTDDVGDFEQVVAWLQAKMPAKDVATCLIHNDFRFDNVVLKPDNSSEVIGVLDWEMATLGDPLMDLGNTLAYWVQADDDFIMKGVRRQPTHLPGMLLRNEVVDYYLDKSGYKVDRQGEWAFYEVYGLFRLAVIAQQIYYRYYHGQTQDKRFAQFVQMNKLLEQMSLQAIERSRL